MVRFSTALPDSPETETAMEVMTSSCHEESYHPVSLGSKRPSQSCMSPMTMSLLNRVKQTDQTDQYKPEPWTHDLFPPKTWDIWVLLSHSSKQVWMFLSNSQQLLGLLHRPSQGRIVGLERKKLKDPSKLFFFEVRRGGVRKTQQTCFQGP